VVPIDFLAAIFGEEEDTDEEKEPSEDEDVDDKPLIRLPKRKPPPAIEEIPVEKTKAEAIGTTTTKRTITVFDLVEDLDVYGPTMPTEEFLAKEHNGSTNGNGIPHVHVVTVEDESEESSSSEDEKTERRKKKAKRKKEKKRSKKHHHKTKKGKRKRRKSESD
jgi:hypothetical protein